MQATVSPLFMHVVGYSVTRFPTHCDALNPPTTFAIVRAFVMLHANGLSQPFSTTMGLRAFFCDFGSNTVPPLTDTIVTGASWSSRSSAVMYGLFRSIISRMSSSSGSLMHYLHG